MADVVATAIRIAYRHIDTAQAYGNERGVGEGLRASGIAPAEAFVTTKLAADCKSYAEARKLVDGSLTSFGLDRIDLMLIYSPEPWSSFRDGATISRGI